jgi:hypothetical protein
LLVGLLTKDELERREMEWRRCDILQYWPGEAEETHENKSGWFMFRQRFDLHTLRIQVRSIRYGNAIQILFWKGGMIWTDSGQGFFFSRVTAGGKNWDNLQFSGLLRYARPGVYKLFGRQAESAFTLVLGGQTIQGKVHYFNVSPYYLLLQAQYIISYIWYINKQLQK